MKKILFVLLILPLVWPLVSRGDIFDIPKVHTVLNKKYDIKNDITAEFGYLPKDAFAKYLAFGGSYTRTFSDFTSWEVVNAFYTLELPAGLKRQLIDYGAGQWSDANFASQRFLVTSNIVFSPVYTKNLLFNSSTVYSQFSFAMGAGVAGFSLATVPAIDAGLIFRFFLSQAFFQIGSEIH